MVHRIWDQYPTIQQELEQVRELMISEMHVLHPDVRSKVVEYILAPGKYIRAGLCLFFAMDDEEKIPEGKRYLAAFIELLHLATLVHDDVIDQSPQRRGIEATHVAYSNRVAIYTGDYLLAYANRMALKGTQLLQVDEGDRPGRLKETIVERILSGELSQLMHQYDQEMTIKAYLKQIQGKTAYLFALACQLGAWRKGGSSRDIQTAFQIGREIGLAFQLSDDLIDYRLSAKDSGKPRLQDLRNGIYTAPFLFAKAASKDFVDMWAHVDPYHLSEEEQEQLYHIIQDSGAFEETEQLVDRYLVKVQQRIVRYQQSDLSSLVPLMEQVLHRQF